MKVLVIDVGGSNVKLMVSGKSSRLKFHSGVLMTPRQFVKQTLALTADWRYDAVAIGFPSPVRDGKPAARPNHLGRGWLGFDFSKHFKKPVKVINDAALQALGCYVGGRLLFLGLGTGLGSALVLPGTIVPLELCGLRATKSETIEQMLCKSALKRKGRARWEAVCNEVIVNLKNAFLADEVVVGGGNAKFLKSPPPGVRICSNNDVLLGGKRLWERRAGSKKYAWTVA